MKKKNIIIILLVGVIILSIGIVFLIKINQNTSKTVTVTFIGENNEVLRSIEIEKGAQIEQWDPEKTNGFLGWYTKDNKVFDFTKKINKDITLYAKWYEGEPEQVAYNVTFLVDMELYQVLEVPENDTMIEPEAPEKEGYTFVGWYENEVLFDFSKPITEEHTLNAVFTQN